MTEQVQLEPEFNLEESIQRDLQEALSKSEEKTEELTKEPEVVEEAPETVEPEADEEAKEVEVEEKEDDAFSLIPKEWSAEEKDKFEDLLESDDPLLKDAAKVLTERYSGLRKGFHKKAEELASVRKEYAPIKELFDPHMQALQQLGQTPDSYVKNLMVWDSKLAQAPEAAIKELMETYKVTPEKLGFSNDADDYYEDDKIARLEKEIESLKNAGKQQLQSKEQASERQVLQAVNDFKHAIDENGEAKYPLFEDVRHEMEILIRNGKATTLEEAYKISPTVKEKTFQSRQEQEKQKQLEAERRKAREAKRSSKTVKSSTGSKLQSVDTRSLEEMLAEGLKEAGIS